MQSRRARGKIVVLCEGDINKYKDRPSPQTYRKLEKWPDANFYKACVWWDQYKPEFFNCGDRKDVLDTYVMLLDRHREPVADSHLDPTKLFAIVDLDIQAQEIENYDFSDTEEIFHDLYDGMNVNERNAARHRIWVTGLIRSAKIEGNVFLHRIFQKIRQSAKKPLRSVFTLRKQFPLC